MNVLFLNMIFGDPSAQTVSADVLRREFPALVVAALCVILGVILVAVSLYFRRAMNISSGKITVLGIFSVFLGFWRGMTLESAALLVPDGIPAVGTGAFFLVAFLACAMVIFVRSIHSAARQAYTDPCTGLVNRARWNELMGSTGAFQEPYGFLMIDLNGLKGVNDTLGHEAGDQMIFRLAAILRNTLPRSSVICRWGGDEFSVLLTDVDRPELDRLIAELFDTAQRYNADHPELPIHFSLGDSLSSEHPGLSKAELFRLADAEMYRSKQTWYAGR